MATISAARRLQYQNISLWWEIADTEMTPFSMTEICCYHKQQKANMADDPPPSPPLPPSPKEKRIKRRSKKVTPRWRQQAYSLQGLTLAPLSQSMAVLTGETFVRKWTHLALLNDFKQDAEGSSRHGGVNTMRHCYSQDPLAVYGSTPQIFEQSRVFLLGWGICLCLSVCLFVCLSVSDNNYLFVV